MNPDTRLFDAMASIDESLIEKGLAAPPTGAKKGMQRRTPLAKKRILAAAIGFALLVSIILPLSHYLFGEDEIAPVRIAVIPESDRIAVGEDLTVSVYCICRTAEDERMPSRATAKVMMSYSSSDPKNFTETVKEIDDATTADYTWNGSFDTMRCETLTVPAEIFTESEDEADETDGVVVWALEVEKQYKRGKAHSDADSAAFYYRIEDGEVILEPEEETMALARTAVEKLAKGHVFDDWILSVSIPTTDRYEHTAKWVAPEVTVLETKPDAALALILIYEEMLAELRTAKLDQYFQYLSEGSDIYPPDSPFPEEFEEERQKISFLRRVRRVIEALLALDRYYDLLSDAEYIRMYSNFEKFVAIHAAAASKYYNSYSTNIQFETYRRIRRNSGIFEYEHSKPDKKTMALARAAVDKLAKAGTFDLNGYSETITTTEIYEQAAKQIAPELVSLERKADAAVALMLIYEEMLEEYRVSELDRFYQYRSSGEDFPEEFKEEAEKIIGLQKTRLTIEALVALDCYYGLLSEIEYLFIHTDFAIYVDVDTDAVEKYYDNYGNTILYNIYRILRNSAMIEFEQ